MRVIRGRAATPLADRAVTRQLVAEAADSDESFLRVWRPHRIVAFGRRDANRPGYEAARQIAVDHGYLPVERSVGGHAVAYTGTTLAFLRAEPIDDPRSNIQNRYEQVKDSIRNAIDTLGVAVEAGEPDGAFCPGCHSLSANGKIAGLAQRVKRDVAVISGVVVVTDHEAIATVLEPIYGTLSIDFDPAAVGSLAKAGGTADPDAARTAIEDELAGEITSVDQLRET